MLQTNTLSPGKVTTITSKAKKCFDDSFVKDTLEIHPTMIPFLTSMEVNSRKNKLQPFIEPVNHNILTSAKVIKIVHTMMGNFCHGEGNKIIQLEDTGNDSCLLMGYHSKVSSDMF